MTDLGDRVNQISNPQQAVEQFVGEQFTEWLLNYVQNTMKEWPVTKKLSMIQTRMEKLKKFMLQRFLVHEAFLGTKESDPGFIGFVIANLSESNEPEAESALEILEQRKRLEESQVQHSHRSHRELWLRMLKSLGATSEEISRIQPKAVTRESVAEVSDIYSTSEWQIAVGAFIAYDWSTIFEYQVLAQLVKNNTPTTEKELEVFGQFVHNSAFSISTGHVLDKLVFDQRSKQLVWVGSSKLLQAKKVFVEALAKYLE